MPLCKGSDKGIAGSNRVFDVIKREARVVLLLIKKYSIFLVQGGRIRVAYTVRIGFSAHIESCAWFIFSYCLFSR